MKLSRPLAVLVSLLVVACEAVTVPPVPSEQISASPSRESGDRELSFPGGGRILFVPSRAPGYTSHGIGILEADGSIRRFPAERFTFPHWDPAASDRLLTLSHGARPEARSLRITGDALHLVGSWATPELFTSPSPDGETIAYTPIDASGHPRTGRLRLVDRPTGATSAVPSGGLAPIDWTPDGNLLAAPISGGRLAVWDPVTGVVARFGSGRLSSLTWAPAGNRFAAVIARGGQDPRGVVVIGDTDGRIVVRISVGRRWVEMPTWSPDGGRIAFIVRGPGRTGHRMASLHVYDVVRGMLSTVES